MLNGSQAVRSEVNWTYWRCCSWLDKKFFSLSACSNLTRMSASWASISTFSCSRTFILSTLSWLLTKHRTQINHALIYLFTVNLTVDVYLTRLWSESSRCIQITKQSRLLNSFTHAYILSNKLIWINQSVIKYQLTYTASHHLGVSHLTRLTNSVTYVNDSSICYKFE